MLVAASLHWNLFLQNEHEAMSRRWYQFGVGRLMLLMAVVATVAAGVGGLVQQGAHNGPFYLVLLAAAPLLLLGALGVLELVNRWRRGQ